MQIATDIVILDPEEVEIIEGFAQEKIPSRDLKTLAKWLEGQSLKYLNSPNPVERMAGDMLQEWRNMLPLPTYTRAN